MSKKIRVGDFVTEKSRPKTHKGKGEVIFVHPKDEVKYIVDFGEEWQGYMEGDLKLAPSPKARKSK